MEQQLCKLMLDHEFYSVNRGRILRSMFPDQLASIYDTIVQAHEDYGRTLTLDEIKALHRANNPMLTRAASSNISELFTDLEESEPVGADVADVVLTHMWKVEVGRTAADIALRVMEGKAEFTELEVYVDSLKGGNVSTKDDEFMPTDVDAILGLLETTARWTFNVDALAGLCPGIAGGEFAIFLARPETGKTAAHVTIACGPKGFCEQGANVLLIVNEEPAFKTILRAMSCCSGLTTEEIVADPAAIQGTWGVIRSRYHVMDNAEMSIEELDAVVKRLNPDVVIVDQLDKLSIAGTFQREDERLGKLYVAARRIAKVNNCALIGLTQASADASGKSYVDYSMMAGSKTGKAAEADLIVGIGKEPLQEDNFERAWTTSKNKISGRNALAWSKLHNQISRYV
jgi:hypothetical protein